MMIRKIMTGLLAVTMASSLISVNSSADVTIIDNKHNGGIPIEVDVRGKMSKEWLAEHDEFDITFEHDGEKTYGFFNKDNYFESIVELYEGVKYDVKLSNDFDGYEVQGYDDTFTPEKGKATIILTVMPTKEKKNGKDITIEEYLVEYKEQRKLVQEFIDLTEKYGLCDDTNEYWQTLSEDDKKFILEESPWCEKYCKNTGTEEEYADVLNVEYGKTDNEILKRRFAFEMLYAQIYYCCHEMTMSNDEYINRFCKGTNNSNAMDNYYGNYDSVVKSIMDYDQSYWDKYHDIPNLYTVYLDIINGVEYETVKKELEKEEVSSEEVTTTTTTTAAPETAPELSVSEVSEAQEVSAPTDDKSSAIEPPMTMSTKKKSSAPLIIGGIIAVIAVGAAAFILGKRSKK